MDIRIIQEAIRLLDKKFNLPNKGFLAGGALANTINKLKWGGKCIINDIDIFLLDEIKDLDEISNKTEYDLYKESNRIHIKKEAKYDIDCYENLIIVNKKYKGNDYIIVKTSERQGIFNYVNYDSNINDYQLLLDTFDINCTMVGYDLETKKCYYTKEFEHFYNTKELQVSLPNTPSHTALRILKKRDELDAKLNIDEEFKLLTYVNVAEITGLKRHWFGDKYIDIYNKYEKEISQYFKIIKSTNKGLYNSYRLYPNDWNTSDIVFSPQGKYLPMDDIFVRVVDTMTIEEYVYFWRNILPNKSKKDIWNFLQCFYKHDNYLDGFDIENFDKGLFEQLSKYTEYKNFVKSLYGLNLVKQLKIIKWMNQLNKQNKNCYEVLFYVNHNPLNSNSYEEFEEKCILLKIKYRKDIHEYKEKITKKENYIIFDVF